MAEIENFCSHSETGDATSWFQVAPSDTVPGLLEIWNLVEMAWLLLKK